MPWSMYKWISRRVPGFLVLLFSFFVVVALFFLFFFSLMAPSSPPFPELTAPHRTLTNDKQAYRRPSLYQSNHSSPVSPNTAYSFASTLSPSTSPPALGTKQHQQQQHNQQHLQPALSASTSTSTSTTATTTSSTTPLLTPHLNNPTHHFTAAQTAALKALSSTAALDPADHAYWTSLLVASKFPPAYTPQDAFDLEMETVALSIELATNNVKTRNFHGLVLHLLSQAHLLLHHHEQHNTW
ncbi:hypothetical protein BC940DRAFT_35590 [Gongronella butleri]|nr:hypothetical protein BC940DRAFT_35590 [Gongronella butleri]